MAKQTKKLTRRFRIYLAKQGHDPSSFRIAFDDGVSFELICEHKGIVISGRHRCDLW